MGVYTTFGIGGDAEIEVVTNENEALRALKRCSFVLGNGSNLLVGDGGIRGLVVKNGMKNFEQNGNFITVQGGCNISTLALHFAKSGYSGLEWAYKLPASVGGAIVSNAGAFGGQTSDCVHSVTLIRNGQILTLNKDECGFSYRSSLFEPNDFILSANLKLIKLSEDKCMQKIELARIGRNAQPKGKSAGCIYKTESKSAGWYIERAGLKGKRVGDALISPIHAGFIINVKRATAREVLRLMEYAENTVLDKFGVALKREIKLIGEF